MSTQVFIMVQRDSGQANKSYIELPIVLLNQKVRKLLAIILIPSRIVGHEIVV